MKISDSKIEMMHDLEDVRQVFIDPDVFKNDLIEDNDTYHANKKFLGSSGLKTILGKSMLHYKYGVDNPEEEKTKALEFGSASHEAWLESDKFKRNYVVAPEPRSFPTKGADGSDEKTQKQQLLDWKANYPGALFISQADMNTIQGMKKALIAHPTAYDLFSNGEAERSFYTKLRISLDYEKYYDISVKCKPDFLLRNEDGSIKGIVSYKTAVDSDPDKFSKAAGNQKYDLSEALYLDILSQFARRQISLIYIVAIEKKPPYAIAIYKFDAYRNVEFISEGRHKYRKALKKFLYCKLSGIDYGYEIDSNYPDGTLDLVLPGFSHDNKLFTKTTNEF